MVLVEVKLKGRKLYRKRVKTEKEAKEIKRFVGRTGKVKIIRQRKKASARPLFKW